MVKIKINHMSNPQHKTLESYYVPFRANTIGTNQYFDTPYGRKKLIYADWTASGRLYKPIEEKIITEFGPYIANTHTESNITGTTMTLAYKHAQKVIKNHVQADEHDVILFDGFGMTSAINKLQRILGIKVPENIKKKVKIRPEDRPIIFVTHMEHHSNHISWYETIGDVVCIKPTKDKIIDVDELERLLRKYKNRKKKIGAFTACSNVTGIQTPYYRLAKKMHEHGGICFIDFSASAPYVEINMHPEAPLEKLDGILFSPHKFLGGPGTSGVLIIDSRLYQNKIPDKPGGGTVYWTNPWGDIKYIHDIEEREDGGTPGFLQAIRTALCIELKDSMGIHQMLARERELKDILLDGLNKIPNLYILDGTIKERLGIVSFYIKNIHYNLIVKLLNDRFGIQVRGGCSCAGTYGHYLLGIEKNRSKQIVTKIESGNQTLRPGWVRISIHPIMTRNEINQIVAAIKLIADNIDNWRKDYIYDSAKNEFIHRNAATNINNQIQNLFKL